MTLVPFSLPRWAGDSLALVAGAIIHLGMAPYSLWPLTLLGIACFASLLRGLAVAACLRRSFAFGLGLYGAGTSWIYISISQFGSTSVPLSLSLTAIFVVAMAAFFIPPFYLLGRLAKSPWQFWLGFPAVYILGEWFHTWFLTGFPWLYLGYAFIDTPLAGWAPLFGVYGVSLAAIFLGLILSASLPLLRQPKQEARQLAVFIALALSLVLGGSALRSIEWTQLSKTPIKLALVQGNIPQEEKWDPDFYAQNIGIYRELSKNQWGKADWIIWPEAAIPLTYHDADAMLDNLDTQGKQTNTTFFSGIIYDELKEEKYYNAIFALGAGGSGIYFKQRLVPFGEYVPFESQLRGLIDFFDLPTSIVHVGPASRSLLKAKSVWVAPAICYELAFPDLIAQHTRDAQVIVSISNNAWFGHSIGPEQHFDMARMRALETGRYLVHGTNNGVTAIVDNKGSVALRAPRFERTLTTGVIFTAEGITPFMTWGVWPVLLLAIGAWVLAWLRTRVLEPDTDLAKTPAPAELPKIQEDEPLVPPVAQNTADPVANCPADNPQANSELAPETRD